MKQKARPITFHLQNFVEKEINKINNFGHLEKVQKRTGAVSSFQ